MIYAELYLTFVKIGVLAFGGGYASIPLLRRFIVEENGWISMNQFVDIISISQMTPGPIAINSATFVGQTVGGLPGAVVATLGSVTPQSLLMMTLGYFLFERNKHFKILDWLLLGIKSCVVSLILITALDLIQNTLFGVNVNVPGLIAFPLAFILYIKGVSLYYLLAMGAVIGFICQLLGG
ncbi:chromate transporter [Peptoniphilus equinus]|uniref:Chromate transporter n=1 Tax=Peptoniphilus equinus TaxID=3016343 RepID=A0ABY7QUZ3_9FIRM|nr:chromate transporter [Peptoniphilus equinus]WBW50003.1 chromate transporter [Peptoniphilus equinus]